MGLGVGAEDEAGLFKRGVAEVERGAGADGEDGWLVGAVGGDGVVVAVEDDEGAGGEDGVHGCGLLGVDAEGDEALPLVAVGGGAWAVAVQTGGGEVHGFDGGGERDAGVVHGRGGGDDGNGLERVGLVGWTGGCGAEVERKDLFDGECLRGEDFVEAFEGEGPFAVEEV